MVQFWGKEEVRRASVQVDRAMKFWGQVSDGGEAGLHDVAHLPAAQEHVGQEAEEQVHAGGGQLGDPSMPKYTARGVHHADDHQDGDGHEVALGMPNTWLMAMDRSGVASEKVVAVPASSAKTAVRSITLPQGPSTRFPRSGRQASEYFLLAAAAHMDHEAEGYRQDHVKAPGNGPPVE